MRSLNIDGGKGTVVNDARAETGGANRTSRSQIRPAVSANRRKEPVLLLDLSTSMNWGAADEYGPEWPDAGSRRAIVDAVTDPGEIALDLVTLVS
jgi:hypothetical protein